MATVVSRSKADALGAKAHEAAQSYLKVCVRWKWPSATRSLKGELLKEVAQPLGADAGAMSAGTHLFAWTGPLGRLKALRRELSAYIDGNTAPYVEDGAKMLAKREVPEFERRLAEAKGSLERIGTDVQWHRDQILRDAKQRRGRAFNLEDYPADLSTLFDLTWSYAPLEVPEALKSLCESAYAAEVTRQAVRMQAAVHMAEQAKLAELAEMTGRLAAQLAPREGEQRAGRIYETSLEAVQSFARDLSAVITWGADEIEELAQEAGDTVGCLTVAELRINRDLAAETSRALYAVSQRACEMLREGGEQ